MLRGTEETDLQVARRYFGPILLHTGWLSDKDNGEAFSLWGQRETNYRLIAVCLGNLCVAIVAIAGLKKRTPSERSATQK